MSSDLFLNLLYLVLLLLAVGGVLMRDLARNPSRTTRFALTWGFIFLGLVAAAGLWSETSRALSPATPIVRAEGHLEIPVSADGHYRLVAEINGVPVRFIVDTGASQIVLTRRDAERIGLSPQDLVFTGRASTANGEVRIAPVRLARFEVAGFVQEGLRAVVSEGEMSASLLGMSYLSARARVSFDAGRMVIAY